MTAFDTLPAQDARRLAAMTNCSTAGHEKIPAVSVLVMDDDREAPLCQACETRRYAEMREAAGRTGRQ